MNVLFLSNVFPNPYQPTKGTFNRELVRAVARNCGVQVISPISWIDEWRARRSGSVPLNEARQALRDGATIHYPRYYYPPRVLRSWYGWFMWRSIRATVERVLREHRPDAVLGYWAHPDGEMAVRAARAAGLPAVVMVGGSDVLLLARKGGRRRRILRVLQRADAVVATSKDLKNKVARMGIGAEKIHVLPRGIDSDLFQAGDRGAARNRLGVPNQTPVLLWVGRMVPVKGLDVLLEACGRLLTTGPPFHLYLIGDGPLRRSLERDCAVRGLAQRVSFVGSVPHDRLADWYCAADLTVLPSRSEGIPNVLRESQACGTPFVASRVGGIQEIAEEPADRLVAPEDPIALALAIEQSLREPRSRPPRPTHPLSWNDSADLLVGIMEALVSGRRTKVGIVECGSATKR